MTSPNECLQMYTALKLHFSTPDYDYIKYKGKLKNPPKFEKRKDKQFFSWLSNKPDPKGIMIANLSKDPTMWIGAILQDKAKTIYADWKKRQESLTYIFKSELEKLVDKFPQAFIVKGGQHPQALKLYMQDEVSLDTLVILNAILNFLPNWDKKLANDPVWLSVRLPLYKYRAFLEIDQKKFVKILHGVLKENT